MVLFANDLTLDAFFGALEAENVLAWLKLVCLERITGPDFFDFAGRTVFVLSAG